MDQQQLYAFTADAIQAYDTDRAVPQSDVTAIANLLFDCADKDGRHGYVRKSENVFRSIRPRIVLDNKGNVERPDKAKMQKTVYRDAAIIRVVHVEGERKVLIVVCKSDQDFTGRAMDQIRAYMNYFEFPAGLLLSQRRAFFFFQGKDDEEGVQPGPEFSDISQHVPEIADIIREL